jgi:hypothetical protein
MESSPGAHNIFEIWEGTNQVCAFYCFSPSVLTLQCTSRPVYHFLCLCYPRSLLCCPLISHITRTVFRLSKRSCRQNGCAKLHLISLVLTNLFSFPSNCWTLFLTSEAGGNGSHFLKLFHGTWRCVRFHTMADPNFILTNFRRWQKYCIWGGKVKETQRMCLQDLVCLPEICKPWPIWISLIRYPHLLRLLYSLLRRPRNFLAGEIDFPRATERHIPVYLQRPFSRLICGRSESPWSVLGWAVVWSKSETDHENWTVRWSHDWTCEW